ncbi:hypothetical protein WDW37_11195 [Bdellovibrionota bacterium FG-1]
MLSTDASPRWLRFLERKLGWLAVPHIAVLFITLQALGFVMVNLDPLWVARLALIPEAVTHGEIWRLVTFLALPLSLHPLWVIFALWFLYFIINTIENEWGAFKTTLYVLISIVVTIIFSMLTGYPITEVADFESTLFLAAAALFPETEIQLFFVVPVKIKWLAWFALAGIGWKFLQADWLERFFMLAIYSNCLVFFGPSLISQLRQTIRREQFRRKMRR